MPYLHQQRCDLGECARSSVIRDTMGTVSSREAVISRHGCSTAYMNHGCRCEPCRAWQRERLRKQRDASKARQAEELELELEEEWGPDWAPSQDEVPTIDTPPVTWPAVIAALSRKPIETAMVPTSERAYPIIEAQAWATPSRRAPGPLLWVQLHCGHGLSLPWSSAWDDAYPCDRCEGRWVTRFTTSTEGPGQRWGMTFTAPVPTIPPPIGRQSIGLAIVPAGQGCPRHTTAIGSDAPESGWLWCETCGDTDGWVPYAGACQGASPPPGTRRAYVADRVRESLPA